MAVYTLNSELSFSKKEAIDLAAEEVKPAVSLAGALKQARGISFILLKLKDAGGHELSRNNLLAGAFQKFQRLETDDADPGRNESSKIRNR